MVYRRKMDIDFIKPIPLKKGFLAVEKITFIYTLLTTLLILYLFPSMNHPVDMLLDRVIIVGITIGLSLVSNWWPSKVMLFVRVAFQMGLLSYWYPDTYEFNRLFDNLDHVFASMEQSVFGCQPAELFSSRFSSPIISEAFYLGYFSYYPMIGIVTLAYCFCKFEDFDKVAFIIVGAFFLYYILYIFIPVAGPQFYFPVIGAEAVSNGLFNSIGQYFNSIPTLLQGPGYEDGLFYNLVKSSQEVGERPTAAFPSSHVGISTILLIISYRLNKKIMYVLIPFYILLCGATVYIQAHYVIDVIGGWLSAFIIYGIITTLYSKLYSNSALY